MRDDQPPAGQGLVRLARPQGEEGTLRVGAARGAGCRPAQGAVRCMDPWEWSEWSVSSPHTKPRPIIGVLVLVLCQQFCFNADERLMASFQPCAWRVALFARVGLLLLLPAQNEISFKFNPPKARI